MRAKEVERLLKSHVLPELPGFEAKGRLLFRSPIADLLHFFHFDASAFEKEYFYIHAAVMPLYVPQEHVHFGFGRRVGGGWDMREGETREAVMKRVLAYIEHEGLAFLGQVRNPGDFVEGWVALTNARPENPLLREPIAYSLVLAGRLEEASQALRELYDAECEDPEPRWPEVAAARLERLERVIAELDRDPQEAIDLLRIWRLETLANLKLLDYAADYAASE